MKNSKLFISRFGKICFLTVIMLFVILPVIQVSAADKRYGNFTYQISNGKVSIVKYQGKDKVVNIPAKIKGYKVTGIGDSAFRQNKTLTKVKIPSGINKVGSYTFANCTRLNSIELPKTLTSLGSYAFSSCESLKKIVLPGHIKTISAFAFNECTKLQKINIPKGITTISYSCFYNCSNLEDITLPDSITSIETTAFYNCRKLNTHIPANVKKIENLAFYNCESLPDIIIPSGLESVPYKAFYGCRSAKILKIPDTVTSLNSNAFDYCSGIKEVIIPDRVSTIPLFIGCNSLEKIQISDNNKNYTVEDGVFYNKDKTTLIRYTPAHIVEGYQIPDTVTSLDDYAFSGLSTIKELIIPDTVKSIGKGLFCGSTSIENVTFPSNITVLPEYTFCDTNLKEVVIPKNITKVGYQAYANCKQMISITIPALVTSIGDDGAGETTAAIPGCSSLKEFVVDPDNQYYKAIDGVLYKKLEDGKSRLICYPSKKEDQSFHIPEGTTDMCIDAFEQCNNLHKLYLPEGMIGLYNYFNNCANLDIMVPATVTRFVPDEHSLDWPVFTNCTNCYLYVKKGSDAYKYCLRNTEVPYKIWK